MARWRDPTYGRIDRDIQEAVDEWVPRNIGQRVAVENTLQEQRDRRASYPFREEGYRARRRLGRWESLVRYLLRWWQT